MNKYVYQAALKTLPKYVDAIEQNALSRRVCGLSGDGGTERNRRQVNGSSTDFDLGFIYWRRFLDYAPQSVFWW